MKKILLPLCLILLTLFTSGCVQKINQQGLVFAISQEELNDSIQDSFPLKETFPFGSISIHHPNLAIEQSNRINLIFSIDFDTLFTKTETGVLKLSGAPNFDATKRWVYLKEIKLEHVSFSEKPLDKTYSEIFFKAINPMINEAFKTYPIYKIPNDSFHQNLVKDVKVEEGKLLITYGI